jgi:hypothetical protein
MNAIIDNLSKRNAAEADASPLTVLALFCGVGLLASLCMIFFGFDISGGIF